MELFDGAWPLGLAAFGGFLVFVFTYFLFPRELEAEGKGRMPRKFVAELLFSGLNLLFFAFLIFAVQVAGHRDEIRSMLDAFGVDATLLSVATVATAAADGSIQAAGAVRIGSDTVVTAFAVFFGLFGLRYWRGIEAGALAQLHNISLIEEDARDLSATLCKAPFGGEHGPTTKVVAALENLQSRVPEPGGSEASSLPTKWRKLQALLQLWEHDATWMETLPKVAQPDVKALRHAHDRRARLAEEVSDHVAKVERGEADPAALASMFDLLDGKGGGNAEEILAEMRSVVREFAPAGGGKGLGQGALTRLLTPLSGYFHEEYDEAMRVMALATAKSVVQCGDRAGERLEALTAKGFTGIGDAPVINLNKAIWMIAATYAVLAVIFFGCVVLMKLPPEYGFMALVFAGSISFAVVVAAMVGGLRGLASRREPQWQIYIPTAVALAAGHVLLIAITVATVVRRAALSNDPALESLRNLPFGAFLLGGIFPLVLVLCMCWLSRRQRWPGRRERLVDALVLGGVCALAMALTVPVADWLGIDPVFYADGPARQVPLPMPHRAGITAGLFGLVGIFVGGFVVRPVRAAATARFVLDTASGQPAGTMPRADAAGGVVFLDDRREAAALPRSA